MNKKTTILAVAGIVLLGGVILGGIGGYGYFQECLWDKEYLHVLQDLKEAEQAKEYERLLQTAKADKKPYLRNIISGYYFAVKDYPKAKAHLTQAEAEFSEIGDVGGQIRTLYSLGCASLATDNPDEAEKYMSKALKLFGDKDEIDSSTMPLFGFRIPGTLPSTPKARIISSLARLKARTGHPAEAEALYKQAILDKETYERVSSYTDYADFLTNQKRQKEAAAMLKTAEESIEAQKHGKGEYDSSELALSSLASHYEFASEFSQALRIYKKCAERTAQSKGASSDEHIRTLVQIAQCYEKMGQEEDEHKVLEDAYKLAKDPNGSIKDPASVGLRYWCIINAAEPLAGFHFRKKNYAMAESLYRESIDQLAAHEKDVPVYLRSFDWTKADLAACLAAEGKNDEAESLYRGAAKALESDTRVSPIRRLKVLNGYAAFLHSLGKDKESAEFTRKAEAFKKEAMGARH